MLARRSPTEFSSTSNVDACVDRHFCLSVVDDELYRSESSTSSLCHMHSVCVERGVRKAARLVPRERGLDFSAADSV